MTKTNPTRPADSPAATLNFVLVVLAVAVAATVTWIVAAIALDVNTHTGCTVLVGETPSEGEARFLHTMDYDPSTGAWVLQNGEVFGWSAEEDTPVYDTEECAR